MPKDNLLGLAARADMARLLSAAYYEPGPEFAEEALFESLLRASEVVSPAFGEVSGRLKRAFDTAEQDSLLIDYVRLFHGPPKALAQPYGAVWLSAERSLMQDSTKAVLDLYRDAGFELADDFRDLPDHISVELECLYTLLFREAQVSRQEADRHGVQRVLQLRARLLDHHLGRWAEPFADAIASSAQTDFYRELATLTRSFIAGEHQLVADFAR